MRNLEEGLEKKKKNIGIRINANPEATFLRQEDSR